MTETGNNTTTIRKAKITGRVNPCRCGCKGRDTWHRTKYTRTIKDVRPVSGHVKTTAWGRQEVVREGWARFPFGVARVVEIALTSSRWDEETGTLVFTPVYRRDGTRATGGWTLDADSYLDAQNRTIEGE